jgi:aerobic-type carbon monoxide dehydrogenase small subunit (CoxS/CutS family)
MLVAADALLRSNVSPTEDDVRDAIAGNLCRCTGYQRIVDAILNAAARLRDERALTGDAAASARDGGAA